MTNTKNSNSPRSIRRRRAVESSTWRNIFKEAENFPIPLVAKLNPEIPQRTLYRKIKQYKQAKADGSTDLNFLQKNVHKQIMTPEQEIVLADEITKLIDEGKHVVTKYLVKRIAQRVYDEFYPNNCSTRGAMKRSFKVSNGWICRFKVRHDFLRRKPEHIKKIKESEKKDRENLKYDFVCLIEEAVDKYGPDCVMNMDETPAWCRELPASGWTTRKRKHCKTESWGNPKQRITIIPTITVSGKKLAFGWINRAKSLQAISKMKIDGQIRSYFSESGWINAGIMVRYLDEIVKPYLRGRPGALIIDDYAAHWEENVIAKAEELKLELICVPPGCTADFQPLDISVNGPMKQTRVRLQAEERWESISTMDNLPELVNRAYKAYQSITPKIIHEGWIKACPTIEHLFE